MDFESYPFNPSDSTGHTSTQGTTTQYDGLQRVTSVSQYGGGTTTTNYLHGHKTQVTNARCFATTTTYLAYDQPTQGQATKIESLESIITCLSFDVFNNITQITQITQGNGTNNVSEYRYYNDQNR